MANYVMYNEFHATRATVRPRWDGTLSHAQIRRAWRRLCGIQGCTCGDAAGARPAQVECVHQGATAGDDIYRIIRITEG